MRNSDQDRAFAIDVPPRTTLSIFRNVGSLALAIATSCDDIPATCISYLPSGSPSRGTGYANESDETVRLFLVGEHDRQLASEIDVRFRAIE